MKAILNDKMGNILLIALVSIDYFSNEHYSSIGKSMHVVIKKIYTFENPLCLLKNNLDFIIQFEIRKARK